MIVTVTLNPALRVRYDVPQVRYGAHNDVSGVSYLAAGRGLVVARILHAFGHEVVAAGLAGGAAGELIKATLARSGVATQFTAIGRESRRVLEISDASGAPPTAYGEPAPYITTEELGRLAADYRRLMTGAIAAVLSGSLPAGMPPETYGTLASYAADAGVPVVLDADGPSWHGASRRPALVITTAPSPADPGALVAGDAGAVAVVADQAVQVVTGDDEWLASLDGPFQLSRSRDAIVAGFVPGIALGWSWPDMLRHAVALAASEASWSFDESDLAAYERLLPAVVIDRPRERLR
jgi:fructose-1-phosphate kinase PfkB-like protein